MPAQATAPMHIIRLGVQGEPTLLISTTSLYDWVYSDKGSGADMDVTIWRPHPGDASYSIIGDYAQGNYGAPTGSALIVKAINDDPQNPLLQPPQCYNQVWTDKGSGGDHDGSIWFPVPPDGYFSIGFVGQSGYDKPSLLNYACLRRDLVEQADVGALIWNDKGSGADQDVSLYQIVGVANAFVAQGNYNPYSGNAYRLKGMA